MRRGLAGVEVRREDVETMHCSCLPAASSMCAVYTVNFLRDGQLPIFA